MTKSHKILIKTIQLRERTSFEMVNFHNQMAIRPEGMVRYGPLSNLKKTFCYEQCDQDQVSLNLDQNYSTYRGDIVSNGE